MNFYGFVFGLTDGSEMEGWSWGYDPKNAFENLFNHKYGDELRTKVSGDVDFEKISTFKEKGIFLVSWQAIIGD